MLRIGLLGCGGIAARHAGAVKTLGERMELVACCGRDLARTEAFAAQHGGRTFVDMDAMIDAGLDPIRAAARSSARRSAACNCWSKNQ